MGRSGCGNVGINISQQKGLKIGQRNSGGGLNVPDYSQTNTTMGTDARTTLLWQPYILTDAANRKIPVTFYNNDFSKKLKLVLEGINAEGKMIHIEKLIE